ncbi:MAG: hypothetical protein N2C14_23475, partial [Planctomycetales bacterium]
MRVVSQTIQRLCFVAAIIGGGTNDRAASAETEFLDPATRSRRPVALVAEGNRLFVANRRAGTVSAVDLVAKRVINETIVGGRLADVALVRDGKSLLLVDEQGGRLVLLDRQGDQLRQAGSHGVASHPVNVVTSENGEWCAVASLWSRRISFVELLPATGENAPRMKTTAVIDLPFAPRLQLLTRDGRYLIAADSLGGRLGVIDVRRRKLRAIRRVEGHGIRGLTLSPDGREVVIAQQLLNGRVPTAASRIFWGAVVSSVARSVRVEEFLRGLEDDDSDASDDDEPIESEIAHWSLFPLGEPGKGSGDPGEILITRKGQVVVALSGINEVGVRAARRDLIRLAVGRRPTALALNDDQTTAYVAETLGDSISILDLAATEIVGAISLRPRPSPSLADRGEELFYNARLSHADWYSCHSCHPDGHSNGRLNDNLSDGSHGSPKRVLSLLGVADSKPWAWTGSQAALETQI